MIDGQPGLYAASNGRDPESVKTIIPIGVSDSRVQYLKRDRRLEEAAARALGLEVIAEEDQFLCDRCGRPARTVSVEGQLASCPECLARRQ